jgi:hypothetical protein
VRRRCRSASCRAPVARAAGRLMASFRAPIAPAWPASPTRRTLVRPRHPTVKPARAVASGATPGIRWNELNRSALVPGCYWDLKQNRRPQSTKSVRYPEPRDDVMAWSKQRGESALAMNCLDPWLVPGSAIEGRRFQEFTSAPEGHLGRRVSVNSNGSIPFGQNQDSPQRQDSPQVSATSILARRVSLEIIA